MKIYNRHSALTHFADSKKADISPNLSYSYSLNRECIDLKYVATLHNYPVVADYYLYPQVVQLPEANKTYFLDPSVQTIYLPTDAQINDSITLISESGWNLKLFSTCLSLYIDDDQFTFLELRFCAYGWKIVKKGTHIYSSTSNRVMYVVSAKSTSLMDEIYLPHIFGYGYLNFADIYELYSVGLADFTSKVERFRNTVILFSDIQGVNGPVQSIDYDFPYSSEFPFFQIWEVLVNSSSISDQLPDRLKLKFSPYLVQQMPKVSAMIRDINFKFINSVTNTIDPIYTLNPTDTLVEVVNVSTKEKMLLGVDYTQSNNHILPLLRGGIFHDNDLLIKFWGDNFIS